MIRFIHTADIHFGMENYGKIDPKTGIHSRLLDFYKALNFCVEYAIREKVDFFLFCGDAYKTAHPSQTQQKLFFELLLKLEKASIPVVIIIGNHDHPLSFGKAHALNLFGQLPFNGFYVVDKPKIINIETKNGPVQLIGIPWPTRNTISLSDQFAFTNSSEITQEISRAVGILIRKLVSSLAPGIPSILASHLTVSTGIFSGSEKRAIYGTDPCFLPSQLALAPLGYVALGHLHRYQNLNSGGIPVVYSGSIERVDFGERKEEKGFCDVQLPLEGPATHQFIPTPTRPFVQIELKLHDDIPYTDQLLHAISTKNIQDAIVKILYHIPNTKKFHIDLKVIEAACAHAMYLVGIFPVFAPAVRQTRNNSIVAEQDILTLMNIFCDDKPELKIRKQALLEKTQQLLQEISDVVSEE